MPKNTQININYLELKKLQKTHGGGATANTDKWWSIWTQLT